VGAPVTVFIGWFTVPYILMMQWTDDRPQVDSFVASPNPVTAGSRLTLTLSNFTGVRKVAFHVLINDTKTLLGYGTETSWETWTLDLTVGLAPGSYTLLAQIWGERGASRVLPGQLTLTVQ
jgi:hypothetical protein